MVFYFVLVIIKTKRQRHLALPQFVEKVCIYKKRANSLSLSPNPFPSVKGCVCFVGSASCRAFGHTRPASVPGLSVGLPPSPRLGLRPKPHFQKLYRFIDSLRQRRSALSLMFLKLYVITPVRLGQSLFFSEPLKLRERQSMRELRLLYPL